LKFFVHFVQDVHQPLHLSGRDRGGNDAIALFDGHQSNLHAVWDTLLLVKYLKEEFHGSMDLLAGNVTAQLETTWKSDKAVLQSYSLNNQILDS
jgi:L-ascorbate metabolism protein UlaG (beta-lactamase superfamily)